jgi:splicing factor U2AF subunit
MAGALERLYGTEEDKVSNISWFDVFKVNCPFFIKIGACRYENKC